MFTGTFSYRTPDSLLSLPFSGLQRCPLSWDPSVLPPSPPSSLQHGGGDLYLNPLSDHIHRSPADSYSRLQFRAAVSPRHSAGRVQRKKGGHLLQCLSRGMVIAGNPEAAGVTEQERSPKQTPAILSQELSSTDRLTEFQSGHFLNRAGSVCQR